MHGILGQELTEMGAHDALGPQTHHQGKALIAVQHRSIRTDRDRTVLHLLYQGAIGPVCSLQRVNLLTRAALDHQRIHFSVADGSQRVFGFAQALAKVGDADLREGPGIRRFRRSAHGMSAGYVNGMLKPASTRRRSDKSPTIRRGGSGDSFTRVGVAMICKDPVASGFW